MRSAVAGRGLRDSRNANRSRRINNINAAYAAAQYDDEDFDAPGPQHRPRSRFMKRRWKIGVKP